MKEKQLPYHGKSGFKVPENYFQDFETRMMMQVTSEKSQANNPFKVPEGYFAKAEAEILEKVGHQASEPKVVPLFSRKNISYIAGIAAVLAILFSTMIFNDSQKMGFEDLDMIAVENYLLETLDFENPEETPLINEREFSYASSVNSDLDREAVLQYLQENIDEPSLLLNEE